MLHTQVFTDKENSLVAWKQIRKIILFGCIAKSQCFTEPYKSLCVPRKSKWMWPQLQEKLGDLKDF